MKKTKATRVPLRKVPVEKRRRADVYFLDGDSKFALMKVEKKVAVVFYPPGKNSIGIGWCPVLPEAAMLLSKFFSLCENLLKEKR